jgi:transposase-like protein
MSVTDLCHEYGISRPTAYKWIKRYDEVGPEGLLDLSARRTVPHTPRHPRSRTKSLHYGSGSPPGERGSLRLDWSA